MTNLTNWGTELSDLKAQQARIQKRIALIEQLAALDQEDAGGNPSTSKAAKAATVSSSSSGDGTAKKRGRPRKDVSASPASASDASDDGKAVKLPALLRTIGQSVNKVVTMPELVNLVKESGYKSEAKDYHNMVYQCMQKLVKSGHFKKTTSEADPETRAYEWIAQADAA